jgi:aspartate-semialdehyde dehydrogenase
MGCFLSIVCWLMKKMFGNIAVVGATGAVGSIVLELLESRQFPCRTIKFLASKRSAGKRILFRGEEHVVAELCPDAFKDVEIVIASTPDEVSLEFTPWAVEQGAVVIDESGAHRMMEHVPLIVPEVNPEAIDHHRGIIASPNCSTTQMAVAMKPIHDAVGIQRVVVSTYQAPSGAGLNGDRELLEGSRAFLDQTKYEYQTFTHPIAFNLIPQIGSEKEAGYTSEEMKMVHETRKIFGDESIQICPTCVRVPVVNCHSESMLVETRNPLSVKAARNLFEEFKGITLLDDLASGSYPMPISCDKEDDVYVGRLRKDISSKNGIAFWCVSDNLRKGAATNAVQIAELLMQRKATCGA